MFIKKKRYGKRIEKWNGQKRDVVIFPFILVTCGMHELLSGIH